MQQVNGKSLGWYALRISWDFNIQTNRELISAWRSDIV